MDKNVNLVECSGRLTYKRYNEETKQLFLVLYIAVPRVTRKKSGADVMRDAPGFVYEGSDAKELNDKLKINDKITLIGHAGTDQSMEYQGNRTYREVYRTSLIADSILFGNGLAYDNTAIIAGKIIRVYRNPENGKRFYIVTVETKTEEEKIRASFTYFDYGMRLEPKVGDYIHAIGAVHVKHEKDENSERDRILTTLVARTVGINEREKEREGNATFKTVNAKKEKPQNDHVIVEAHPLDEDDPDNKPLEDNASEGWDSF